jgi:hypothetical protein
MKFIDYIYYKITRLYLKSEGQYSMTAISFIALTLTLFFLEFFFGTYNYFIPNPYIARYRSLTGMEAVGIGLVFLFLVYWRYRKGYYFFRRKFENESAIQSFFGWLLVIAFHIFPWVMYLWGNSQL